MAANNNVGGGLGSIPVIQDKQLERLNSWDSMEAEDSEDTPDNYILPEYFTRNMKRLEEFRKKGKMTDVTLRGHNLDGTESPEKIQAHKIILSLSSSYFEKLFSSNNQKFSYVVPIQVFVLNKLVSYMYTGKLPDLLNDNLTAFLLGARVLELEKIISLCHLFLKANVTLDNFREIRKIGGLGPEVKQSIMTYIHSNFEKFSLTKEFLSLNFDEIKEIISYSRPIPATTTNALVCTSTSNNTSLQGTISQYIPAETLLKRILHWVQSDINDRQKYLCALIQNINLSDVRADIMKDCVITLSASYQQSSISKTEGDQQLFSSNFSAIPTRINSKTEVKAVKGESVDVKLPSQNQNNVNDVESVESKKPLFSINTEKLPSSSASAHNSQHDLLKQRQSQVRNKARKLRNKSKLSERMPSQSQLKNPHHRVLALESANNGNSSSSSMMSSPEIKLRSVAAVRESDSNGIRISPTQNRLLALADPRQKTNKPQQQQTLQHSNKLQQKQQDNHIVSKVTTMPRKHSFDAGHSRRRSLSISPSVLSKMASVTTEESNSDSGSSGAAVSSNASTPLKQKERRRSAEKVNRPLPKSDPTLMNSTRRRVSLAPSNYAPLSSPQNTRLSPQQKTTIGPGPSLSTRNSKKSQSKRLSSKASMSPSNWNSKGIGGQTIFLSNNMTPVVRVEKLSMMNYRSGAGTKNAAVSGQNQQQELMPVVEPKNLNANSKVRNTVTRRASLDKNHSNEPPAVKKIRLSTSEAIPIATEIQTPTPLSRTDTSQSNGQVACQTLEGLQKQNNHRNLAETNSSNTGGGGNFVCKQEIADAPILQEFVDNDPILTISPNHPLMIYVAEPRSGEYAVMAYDFYTKSTAPLVENACIDRNKFGMVQRERKLYLIGGRNDDDKYQASRGRSSLSTIIEFDKFPRMSGQGSLLKVMWCSDTPLYAEKCMKEARSECGTAVWKNNIYAMGGRGLLNQSLKSVEALDVELNCWKAMAEMKCSRENFGVSTLKDQIYAVGGWTITGVTSSGAATSSAECYVPELNIWQDVAPLTVKRCGVRTTVLDGLLYAVGGSCYPGGPVKYYSHFETYDPREGKWMRKMKVKNLSMKNPRKDAAVIAVTGKIYAVGGDNANPRGMASVEVYDPRSSSWFMDGNIETGGQFSSVAFLNVN